MADFNKYWEIVKGLEGTVYENNPKDTAGSTKFGIVVDDLEEYNLDENHDGTINWKDVRDLTESDAKKVMKKLYWDFFYADNIPNQSLASFIVDSGLNQGRVLITKYIQQILNINVDGKFGNISLKSLLSSSNNKSIFDALYQKRKDRYAAIIKNNPSQKTFERGWENRLNAIKYSI